MRARGVFRSTFTTQKATTDWSGFIARWQRRRCEILREKFGSPVFVFTWFIHSVCQFFFYDERARPHTGRMCRLARSATKFLFRNVLLVLPRLLDGFLSRRLLNLSTCKILNEPITERASRLEENEALDQVLIRKSG